MHTKSPKHVPLRNELAVKDTWDLSALFATTEDWEKELQKLHTDLEHIESFKGRLGESLDVFIAALQTIYTVEERLVAIAVYAELSYSENLQDSKRVERHEKSTQLYTEFGRVCAFFSPELLQLEQSKIDAYCADSRVAEFRRPLEKILRQKKHILSEKEEKLLATQALFASTSQKSFSVLTNVDMQFGNIDIDGQEIELTQSSFTICLEHQDRKIREKGYTQFYDEFSDHKNTLASLYSGSIHHDIYTARSRNHPSARAMSLFSNDIPESVYDALIEGIHGALPLLHRYYAVRKKLLAVDTLMHYDVYVPLIPDIQANYPFDQAVEIMLEACAPLGNDYCETLRKGVEQRWIDRYESKGKRSGAFSCSAYRSYPYILLNYRDASIDSVFTLVHEAGHSMHSHLSSLHNPYPQYQYTIFEAEIASTLNELLLSHHLEGNTSSLPMQQYLLNKKLDGFIGTMFRQTMFAEFEHLVHTHAEKGESLSLDYFTDTYRALLEQYFGSGVSLPDCASLECLRIPHFYSAFYVYKYATGIAAATCFADEIIQTGDPSAFLAFLKRGGSMFPLENLKESRITVERALHSATTVFEKTLDTFEALCEQAQQ